MTGELRCLTKVARFDSIHFILSFFSSFCDYSSLSLSFNFVLFSSIEKLLFYFLLIHSKCLQNELHPLLRLIWVGVNFLFLHVNESIVLQRGPRLLKKNPVKTSFSQNKIKNETRRIEGENDQR